MLCIRFLAAIQKENENVLSSGDNAPTGQKSEDKEVVQQKHASQEEGKASFSESNAAIQPQSEDNEVAQHDATQDDDEKKVAQPREDNVPSEDAQSTAQNKDNGNNEQKADETRNIVNDEFGFEALVVHNASVVGVVSCLAACVASLV